MFVMKAVWNGETAHHMIAFNCVQLPFLQVKLEMPGNQCCREKMIHEMHNATASVPTEYLSSFIKCLFNGLFHYVILSSTQTVETTNDSFFALFHATRIANLSASA